MLALHSALLSYQHIGCINFLISLRIRSNRDFHFEFGGISGSFLCYITNSTMVINMTYILTDIRISAGRVGRILGLRFVQPVSALQVL